MRLIRKFFKWIWYLCLLIQVVLVIGFVRVYRQWNEPPVRIDRRLDRAIQKMAEQLPSRLPKPDIAGRPLLLLPLVDDRAKQITGALRTALNEDGNFHTVDQSTLNQILTKLGIRNENVTDPAEAIKLGKAANAEVVIMGRVLKMRKDESQSLVEFRAQAYQVSDAAPLFKNNHFTNVPPKPVVPPSKTPKQPLKWPATPLELAGLLCFVLVWPVLLVPLVRKILDREKNTLNAITLVAVIAVPVTVSWFAVLSSSEDWLGFQLLVLVLVLTALWSTFVLNQVAAARDS